MPKSKKVLKAGIGYTVGNYLLKGLAFFSIPIFSRIMSTSDYGIYNTFSAYESIIFVVIGLALHSSFKNAKYKYGDEFGAYLSSCVTTGLLSFFTWLLIANLLYPLYAQLIGFSRTVVNLLLICSMGSALIQYYNVYVSLDYSYDRFLKISAFNAISSIVLSVALIVWVYHDCGYLGRIWGTAIPIMVISVYVIYSFFKKARPCVNFEYIKYGLAFSLPIIPHGISQVILSQFDRIMIKSMIGAAEAGIYSFSYNIYTIIQVTSSSLDNVWGPWFFESANRKEYEKIKSASSGYMTLMMAFASFVLLISPELIKILSPRSYWNSMYAVVPVVLGGFFAFLYTLPVQVEYYYEKTKFIAFGTCSAAVVNILLNLAFIPRFGYVAAAYTTLATYFLYFIFHYSLAKHFAQRDYFDIRVIICDILFISLISVETLVFLGMALIRWITALAVCVMTGVFAERNYKTFTMILEFVQKKKGAK